MLVRSLKLTHFKNYQSEAFSFNPKYNAVVGDNGMGKTNLLDAVYFSCMTKSNFTNQDKHLIQEGAQFMRTEAGIGGKKIVCKFEKGKKKIFEVNKKVYQKLSDHIGQFPVVFVVPGDQTLLLEGSIERRKLLDNSISQINSTYLEDLIKYNTLLRQRNAYLKVASKGGRPSKEMLLTYTEQMTDYANAIHRFRKDFVLNFEKVFQEKYEVISGGLEKSSCSYKSQLSEGDFLTLSKENLEKDIILTRTSIGIHKDDLVFKMDGNPIKLYASQGQTKSFILALRLSQFKILAEEKGTTPILLLDDLFDKLDHKRVRQLIELLEAEEVGQVFISDTDTDRVVNILEKMKVSFSKFVINSGSYLNDNYGSEEE